MVSERDDSTPFSSLLLRRLLPFSGMASFLPCLVLSLGLVREESVRPFRAPLLFGGSCGSRRLCGFGLSSDFIGFWGGSQLILKFRKVSA